MKVAVHQSGASGDSLWNWHSMIYTNTCARMLDKCVWPSQPYWCVCNAIDILWDYTITWPEQHCIIIMWTFRMFVYVLFTASLIGSHTIQSGIILQVHFIEILYLHFWTPIMLSNYFQYIPLLCHQQVELHHFIQDCYDHPLQGARSSYITSHHSTDFMFLSSCLYQHAVTSCTH